MVLGKDTKEVHLGKPFYWAWIKCQVLCEVVCQEQWVKPLLLPSNSESQAAVVGKNLPANARGVRNAGSIPGLGRSPGEGNDNPLQYSCLENPMDRGAWRAAVHRVTKSWTRLKRLSTHTPYRWFQDQQISSLLGLVPIHDPWQLRMESDSTILVRHEHIPQDYGSPGN